MDYQKTQAIEGQAANLEQGIYSTLPISSQAPNEQAFRSVGNMVENSVTHAKNTENIEDTTAVDTLSPEPRSTSIVPETPQFEPPDFIGKIMDAPEGIPTAPMESSPMESVPIESTSAEATLSNTSSESQVATSTPAKQPQGPHTLRRENIRTSNDRLSDATLTEIANLEEKLNQDGNIASFYDDIRDAMESNLENSFSRKLGA